MFKKIFLMLALITLAGCTSIKADNNNLQKYERISAATVVWIDGGNIPVKYPMALANHDPLKIISDFLKQVKKLTVESVQSSLSERGINKSPAKKITIRPISAGITFAVLEVSLYDEFHKKIWSIQVGSGQSVFESEKTLIERYSKTIIEELEKAGLIDPITPEK